MTEKLPPNAAEAQRAAVLDLVVAAAIARARCPFNDAAPNFSHRLQELAKEGRVRIEVYTLNWRVVTILDGPHKGKATKACPHNNTGPYKIIPSLRADLERDRLRRRDGTLPPDFREPR